MRLKFKLAVWVRELGLVRTLPELAQLALEVAEAADLRVHHSGQCANWKPWG